MAEKILPHNLDAERAVLGAILRDPSSLGTAFEILGLDGFYHEGHLKIFQALHDLYMRSEPTDLYTVAEELRQRSQLEQIGGPAYLAALLHTVATSANLEHHAEIVKDKAILRTLIQSCVDTAEQGFQELGTARGLVDQMQKRILEMSQTSKGAGFRHVNRLLPDVISHIQERKTNKSSLTGVPTGFDALDDRTAGFQKSDLIVLAARPSVGKTSFALNIAATAAVENHVPTGVFSLEMNAEDILERMLCGGARVNLETVKSGWINDDEFDRLIQYSGRLSSSPLYLDDSPNMPITDIYTRSIRLAAEEPELGLLVLDYLQLISSPASYSHRNENRQQEVAAYSRALKALARELDVPVLVLSQLSRAGEKRHEDPKPRLSDLRDSGAIEQDADMVLFLYQDRPTPKSFMKRDEEDMRESAPEADENIVHLSIAKHRNGALDNIKLYFCREYTRFESIVMEQAPF